MIVVLVIVLFVAAVVAVTLAGWWEAWYDTDPASLAAIFPGIYLQILLSRRDREGQEP